MRRIEYVLYLTFSNLLLVTSQLNLYYTDSVSTPEKEYQSQHDCLRAPSIVWVDSRIREMISYCMSELPSKFHIEAFDFHTKLKFIDLAKNNITSQQLYHWSAPIDLIEDYQQYLNENDASLAKKIFYNCTWPRFGPQCQYEFYNYVPVSSSMYDIIHDFHEVFEYNPINLTCYEHLQCDHRHSSVCLDWTDICNGQIDCLNDGIDEEHCWQLEINECKDNEYRCINGQCIPKMFHRDEISSQDCLDSSDKGVGTLTLMQKQFPKKPPSFRTEDNICKDTPLTSSCSIKYQDLLLKSFYMNNKNDSIREECRSALDCILLFSALNRIICNELCAKNACISAILNTCPDILYISNQPALFGQLYLAFKKTVEEYSSTENIWFVYVCSTISYYNMFFDMINLDNRTCFLHQNMSFSSIHSKPSQILQRYLKDLYRKLEKYHLRYDYNSIICNRSNMYQCFNSSKCISIYRLLDNNNDCPYMDDENIIAINNTDVVKQLDKTHYKCPLHNIYISQSRVRNMICDCKSIVASSCEDERENVLTSLKNISFQTICDGFVELLADEQNNTDETECQQWSCDNTYTHCDGKWNCFNGADELNCHSSVPSKCPSNYHPCISPDTNQLNCLSIQKINDGKVDCLGGTDEVSLCRVAYLELQSQIFYCRNHTMKPCIDSFALCNGHRYCTYGDDEQFCDKNRTTIIGGSICSTPYSSLRSDIENLLCKQVSSFLKSRTKDFKLDGMIELNDYQTKNIALSSLSTFEVSTNEYYSYCHRGIHLRVWLNKQTNLTRDVCLCPSSYYGSNCQYQNQRISLTITFRPFSDSYRLPFAIHISLIDDSDERIIHSYEQITYLSSRHCRTHFNIYLLYATRPKNLTKQYKIHIDFYEKFSLDYRGSVLLPVHYPFLPVQRLVFVVDIPPANDKTLNSIRYRCFHGKAVQYSNKPDADDPIFCQCDKGWSGKYCTIQYTCNCGFGSKCLGVSARNRSICVCPINKFGPRCLLTHTVCENKSLCQHGGRCIPNDEYLSSDQDFICTCEKGFQGNRCEIPETNLIFSFDKSITLSQSVFIHFIRIVKNMVPERLMTFRTISFHKNSMKIYWSQPFHLVIIELNTNNYYLAVKQTIYNASTTISKTIHPSDRCSHVRELLNETIFQWVFIRRVKYYHLPCQNPSLNLPCFYDDDDYFCLCYQFGRQSLANCFIFNRNMTFNCFGRSACENGGQCLQNDRDCPTSSICICKSCFYGARCQFRTHGFSFSLDAILGYHISPDVTLNDQPFIIKISFAFTIIFMLAGLVDSVLSMMIFKNTVVLEVGCGLYLLSSSITTLLTMMMFALKFFILLLAQMTILRNRSFLLYQCYSIDFLLRICLYMGQWLNACVAIERAYTIIKGTSFNKKESKQTAKFVIIVLLIILTGTSIHDPISRSLIDEQNNDDGMKRIWCIVNYGSALQVYNSTLYAIHLFGPFLINLFSSIIIIIKRSRQQANIHKKRPYKQILIEQMQENKHLLTAPIVLVILAIPRLIIVFVSKCLKTSEDVWLFLVGYFISFIPPILTFIIFVLPSKFYKKEFRKSLTQLQRKIQQCLHPIS